MNKTLIALSTTVALAAVGSVLPSCSADVSAADRVARGAYLVSTSGCTDCHTPWHLGKNGPEPDASRHLSGHPAAMQVTAPGAPPAPWVMTATGTNTAWAGPWGVSFTANLTPDTTTGIGTWTEEEFVATIRNGRHRGRGRELLPPMPWPVYSNLTDDDLKAVFAYLRTIPAIANKVPEPLPPAGS